MKAQPTSVQLLQGLQILDLSDTAPMKAQPTSVQLLQGLQILDLSDTSSRKYCNFLTNLRALLVPGFFSYLDIKASRASSLVLTFCCSTISLTKRIPSLFSISVLSSPPMLRAAKPLIKSLPARLDDPTIRLRGIICDCVRTLLREC